MAFVEDQVKRAFAVVTDPDRETKKAMSIRGALILYYGVAMIPMVLGLIISGLLGGTIYTILDIFNNPIAPILAGHTLPAMLSGTLAYYLVVLPLLILLFSYLVYWMGRKMGSYRPNSYRHTLSAIVYGVLPYLLVSWIPIIKYAGLLWGLIVTILAISNLQRTKKANAFITWLLGLFLLVVIVAVVGAIVGLALLL